MAAISFPISKVAVKFAESLYKTWKMNIHDGNRKRKQICFVLPSLNCLFQSRNIWDAEEELVHRIALATLALKVLEFNESPDGDASRSEKLLIRTLNLAEVNNCSFGIASACDLLSSLSMKLGNHEKAIGFLLRALENLRRLGAPEDDNFMICFSLKLCRVYGNNGNKELAELGFKNCLHLQKKKLLADGVDEETFLLWMTILYWYGKYLFGEKKFKEAKSCFQDCYATSRKVRGVLPNQVMVILYNLGEACQMLGEYDEASTHLLKGVALDEKAQNPDLAYFYIKLGKISIWKELHRDAAFWCSRGKNLAKKFKNSDAEQESADCLEKIQNFLVS